MIELHIIIFEKTKRNILASRNNKSIVLPGRRTGYVQVATINKERSSLLTQNRNKPKQFYRKKTWAAWKELGYLDSQPNPMGKLKLLQKLQFET